MILDLINTELLTHKVMRLLQVQDFVQPIHQQRLPINSLDLDLSRFQSFCSRFRSISLQRLHSAGGVFEQGHHVVACHAKSSVGRVLDFLKAHHSGHLAPRLPDELSRTKFLTCRSPQAAHH